MTHKGTITALIIYESAAARMEGCRCVRQIEALYAMQNEQWLEHSRTMSEYKKELNAQHVAMKERFALHESDMAALRRDIVRQLHEAQAALRALALTN